MIKLNYIWLVLLLFTICCNSNYEPIEKFQTPVIVECPVTSNYNNQTGTILNSTLFEGIDGTAVNEKYIYSNNRIIGKEIHESKLIWKYQYEDDLLRSREVIDSNLLLIFRDTLIYNNQKQLIKYYHIISDSIEFKTIGKVQEHTYNENGQRTTTLEYEVQDSVNHTFYNYIWENGNLEEIQISNLPLTLVARRLYFYDSGENYKLQLPDNILKTENLSLNNIIGTRFIIPNGPGIQTCHDCCYSHEYNLDNMPSVFEIGSGSFFINYN